MILGSFDPQDAHFLPPEEFVPQPKDNTVFAVTVAIGYDKAALVVDAPEEFMEWERDKEGSVCNPEVFFYLPEEAGVYLCELCFRINIEMDQEEPLYDYRYVCKSFRKLSLSKCRKPICD